MFKLHGNEYYEETEYCTLLIIIDFEYVKRINILS